MDRAQQPFSAAGLNVPSYVAFGNHDGLVAGQRGRERRLRGDRDGLRQAVRAGAAGRPAAGAPGDDARSSSPPSRPTRTGDGRDEQYRALHATGRQADAHGFALHRRGRGAGRRGSANYYSFSPKPGVRLIAIDTVAEAGIPGPAADGNIDDPQFQWIDARAPGRRRRATSS